jgi:hypothetical protein
MKSKVRRGQTRIVLTVSAQELDVLERSVWKMFLDENDSKKEAQYADVHAGLVRASDDLEDLEEE